MRKGVDEKMEEKEDCRAISAEFLEDLKGALKIIPHTVRENSDLELCFRGNSGDCIVIYRNNHQLVKITRNGSNSYTISLSLNHARYIKSKKEVYDEFQSLGFKNRTGCLPTNGYLMALFNSTDLAHKFIDILTKVKSLSEAYFEKTNEAQNSKIYDYFKKRYVGKGSTPIIDSEGKKRIYIPSRQTEKIQQQLLMKNLCDAVEGYFIYDLEFAEPHLSQKEATEDKNKNHPDMMALHFKNGKPISLTIIEVKSTAAAVNGKSGIVSHLEAMNEYKTSNGEKYIKFRYKRRQEAAKIFNLYKELGLRSLSPEITDLKDSDVKELPIELMFVFTNKIEEYVNTHLKDKDKLIGIMKTWNKENGLSSYEFPIK